jgi:inner membrane protein
VASVFSHPAAALALGPAFASPRAAVATGALLSVLPDVDAVGFWLGVPYGAPLGHRGLTHSVAFAAVLAAVALPALREARLRIGALPLFLFLFACGASHGLFDGITDGGLGVAYFAPLSNARYFLPWRPIPVSPISVTGFLDARGLRVLASEIVWIWLPCATLATAGWLLRRRAAVRSKNTTPR